MIDLTTETVFALTETPDNLPNVSRRGGRKLHKSAAFRWASPGLNGVRLETVRIGGSLCTSREALSRFFGRLSSLGEADSALAPTTAARRREIARADRQLDAMGV